MVCCLRVLLTRACWAAPIRRPPTMLPRTRPRQVQGKDGGSQQARGDALRAATDDGSFPRFRGQQSHHLRNRRQYIPASRAAQYYILLLSLCYALSCMRHLIMRSTRCRLMFRHGACMHALTFEVCFIYHQGLSVIALEVRSGRAGRALRPKLFCVCSPSPMHPPPLNTPIMH